VLIYCRDHRCAAHRVAHVERSAMIFIAAVVVAVAVLLLA
jgi:hypothetical protein